MKGSKGSGAVVGKKRKRWRSERVSGAELRVTVQIRKVGFGRASHVVVMLATHPLKGWSKNTRSRLAGLLSDYAMGWAK